MAALLAVAMLIGVPIAAVLLVHTRWWWLVGTLVLATGLAFIVIVAAQSPSGSGGDLGGLDALASAFAVIGALVCWAYGGIVLALCRHARRKRQRGAAPPPPPELPAARIHR